ncbi:Tankyrase-1-like protein [Dinothrombium tinctorium]|uniref:Tankyrase-1-like protein n=1 Tax=Dinothrombium tinctorium TaxID=1965070 RepID=A0A443R3Q4_9ACAR|nr:Tankyrase-1-like protein [Dinothrombium tinctorium]
MSTSLQRQSSDLTSKHNPSLDNNDQQQQSDSLHYSSSCANKSRKRRKYFIFSTPCLPPIQPQGYNLSQNLAMATMSEDPIMFWLKKGEVDKLEQAVLDGYGGYLSGKTSRIPQVNRFLKQVPNFTAKIEEIHRAVTLGKLRNVQHLIDRKKLAFCRDQMGATPLHKAVIYGQRDIIKYLLEKFGSVIHSRDHRGRTALHYAAVVPDGGELYRMLVDAGADEKATDMFGKKPEDYLNNQEGISVQVLRENAVVTKPIEQRRSRRSVSKSVDSQNLSNTQSIRSLVHRSNIKELIKQGNLSAIEEVVIQGFGDRLIGEHSSAPLVQEFLDRVPALIEQITEIHKVAMKGNVIEFKTLLDRKGMVLARDQIGATPLHKAVLYGHHELTEYIANNFPSALDARDHEGRTALHYAAVLQDDRLLYNILVKAGASPLLPDYKGKSAEFYLRFPDQFNIQQLMKRSQRLNANYAINTANRVKSKSPHRVAERGWSPNSRRSDPNLSGGPRSDAGFSDDQEGGDVDDGSSIGSNGSATNNLFNRPNMRSRPANILPPSSTLKRYEVTSANLKKWIEEQDLESLEGAILEGHGEKVRNKVEVIETKTDTVQNYLEETFPKIMNKIRTIHAAVSCGDVNGLQSYLDKNDYALAKDHLGMAPLHKAVILGHIDVVEFILEKFPETINARDREGRTALHYAAATTNRNGAKIYKILLRAGADPRVRDNNNKTAEYYRVHLLPLPSELSKLAANSKRKTNINGVGLSPLSKRRQFLLPSVQEKITNALHDGDANQLQELVLEGYGDAIIGRSSWGEEARKFLKNLPHFMDNIKTLQASVVNGDLSNCERILQIDSCYLRAKDENGLLPIHSAVYRNQSEIVEYIINKFPNMLNVKDHYGRTPLHIAAQCKYIDLYKKLLELGADPMILDMKGRTADHYLKGQSITDINQKQIILGPTKYDKIENIASTTQKEEEKKETNESEEIKEDQITADSKSVEGIVQTTEEKDKTETQTEENVEITNENEVNIENKDEHVKKEDSVPEIESEEVQEQIKDVQTMSEKVEDRSEPVQIEENKEKTEDASGEPVEKIEQSFAEVKDKPEPIITELETEDENRDKSEEAKESENNEVVMVEKSDDKLSEEIDEKQEEIINGESLEKEEKTKLDDIQEMSVENEGEKSEETVKEELNKEAKNELEKMVKTEAIENEQKKEKKQTGKSVGRKTTVNKQTLPPNAGEKKPPRKGSVPTLPQNKSVNLRQRRDSKGLSESDEEIVQAKKLSASKKQNGAQAKRNQLARRNTTNLDSSKVIASIAADKVSRKLSLDKSSDVKSTTNEILQTTEEIDNTVKEETASENKADKVTLLEETESKIVSNEEETAKEENEENKGEKAEEEKKEDQEETMKDQNESDNQTEIETTEKELTTTDEAKARDESKEYEQETIKDETEKNENMDDTQKSVEKNDENASKEDKKPQDNVSLERGEEVESKDIEENENVVEKTSEEETERNVAKKETFDIEKNEETEAVIDDKKESDEKTGDNEEGEQIHESVIEDKSNEAITEKIEEIVDAENQQQSIQDEKKVKEDVKENELSNENETGAFDDSKEETKSGIKRQLNQSASDGRHSEYSGTPVSTDDRLSELIDNWLKDGDLLRLEHVVIAGQGERLLGKRSSNKQVQEFLELVPAYMAKIRHVHETVVRGNFNEVRQVLTRKRFALSRDHFGASPLHLAVLHGHMDVLVYIITQFPETIDGPDNEGRTALHYAAVIGDEDSQYYEILKKAGASEQIVDKLGHTPLYYLQHPGVLTIRDLLENYKQHPGSAQKEPETVDVWKRPPTADIESRLTPDSSESPEHRGDSADSRSTVQRHQREVSADVHVDAEDNDEAKVEQSIEDDKGAKEEIDSMSTQFEEALKEEKERLQESVDKVMESVPSDGPESLKDSATNSQGSDSSESVHNLCQVKNEKGQTILHLAASRPQKKAVLFKMLAQAEYLIPERDSKYRTIRDVAIDKQLKQNVLIIDEYVLDAFVKCNIGFVQRLSHEGYDLHNVVDADGNDVTSVLRRKKINSMINLLQDISYFQKSKNELHTFIKNDYTQGVVELIESDPSLITAKNRRSRSALHIAVLFSNIDIISCLVKTNPSSVNVQDNLGRTPLHYAMANNKVEEIGKILIEAGANRLVRDVPYIPTNDDILQCALICERLEENSDEAKFLYCTSDLINRQKSFIPSNKLISQCALYCEKPQTSAALHPNLVDFVDCVTSCLRRRSSHDKDRRFFPRPINAVYGNILKFGQTQINQMSPPSLSKAFDCMHYCEEHVERVKSTLASKTLMKECIAGCLLARKPELKESFALVMLPHVVSRFLKPNYKNSDFY